MTVSKLDPRVHRKTLPTEAPVVEKKKAAPKSAVTSKKVVKRDKKIAPKS